MLFRSKTAAFTAEALADLHCHALAASDDGAKNTDMMYAMLTTAYRDGIRFLCFTPHYNPAFFPSDPAKEEETFRQASSFAAAQLPEMRLFLGNEIFCRHNTVDELRLGHCRTLNGTSCVLVEFSPSEEYSTMHAELIQLISGGYLPLLAHAERYRCLYGNGRARELCEAGVHLQGNCRALTGGISKERTFLKGLIQNGLLSVVADDCHNLQANPPGLAAGWDYVARRFGTAAAHSLFCRNALQLLCAEETR